MTNVKPIDGTGHDKQAPRPYRGMIQAVFDCIDACGGATFKQVQKYLPAAVQHTSQMLTKKKLEKVLYNAVYHGYLVHDSTGITDKGYWKIAPLSYYNARRAIIDDLKENRVPRPTKTSYPNFFPRPLWHWHLILSVAALSFLGGLILGATLN